MKNEENKFRQELKDTVDKSCDGLITELEEKQTEQKTNISIINKQRR